MECTEYRADFLSAHADGELDAGELRLAGEHLAGCDACRARFAEELQLKGLVRSYGRHVLPPDLRTKLLGLIENDAPAVVSLPRQPVPIRERGPIWTRPAVWMPTAIAACVVLVLVIARRTGPLPAQHRALVQSSAQPVVARSGSVADFDAVIGKYEEFDKHFEPNVLSTSPGDVAGAYVDAHMPGYLWDFQPVGLKLMGGRLDKLPGSGQLATYTFYKGEGQAILCTRYKRADLPPPGAIKAMGDHYFYNYAGYSICYSHSDVGDFVCLLVTRAPVDTLLESMMIASQ